MPSIFTGADIHGLTSSAVLKASKRKIEELESEFGIMNS
jgi:hypothetical protein